MHQHLKIKLSFKIYATIVVVGSWKNTKEVGGVTCPRCTLHKDTLSAVATTLLYKLFLVPSVK